MKNHLQPAGVCLRGISTITLLSLALSVSAFAAQWNSLLNPPPSYVSSPILLTDGTVIVQGVHQSSGGLGTGLWYKLTPDINGNYRNGTWTQIASFPPGYAPLAYASAVLPDGRVVIEGGEYNGNSQTPVWTNEGAIYDPVANTWHVISPPLGWSTIGDAQSVVLPDGTFMLANCCSFEQAYLNASTLTWTIVGNGKFDGNDEEGWNLLPSGKVLTVDVTSTPNAEVYDPATQFWSLAGSTPVSLVSLCEIGPGVLRPDGTVIVFGATGNTAIYNPGTNVWTTGPHLPTGYVSEDAPAAQLLSGNILVAVSTPATGTCTNPTYVQHTWFYEFNGTSYSLVGGPTNNFPDENRLLVLPTGAVLWTHNSNDVVTYIPNSSTYQSSWQPTISSFPGTVVRGTKNYNIFGTQFNGLTQGGMFGDDYQAATNYPLVRIKNNATGHIFYCRTHNHSTMAVATGSASVSTEFDVPSNAETGASQLFVVANGIPSNSVNVTVQ